MTPYERTQLSRERTAATFPFPSALDCIRYAVTELAEYDDALLRQERAGDKRNHDKAHDPRSELGQCGYMLLSEALQLNGTPQMDVAQREAPHEWEGGERLAYYIALLSDLADLKVRLQHYHTLSEIDAALAEVQAQLIAGRDRFRLVLEAAAAVTGSTVEQLLGDAPRPYSIL